MMPQRTNEFQQVIHSIYLQLRTDATVTESEPLQDGVTGDQREVDVVIATKTPPDLIIGVECRAGERRADVQWVDEMIGKHLTLPTNRLILVSKAGFTAQAKRKAAAFGVETLTLAAAQKTEWTRVVGKLARMKVGFPHIQLTQVILGPPVDMSAIDISSLLFYSPEGTPQGSLTEVADARLDRPGALEHLNKLGAEPGNHTLDIIHTPPVGSYIAGKTGKRHYVGRLVFRLAIHIDAPIEIPLQHRSFKDAQVAFGAFELPDERGLLTFVEEEGKPLSADLRLAPKKKKHKVQSDRR